MIRRALLNRIKTLQEKMEQNSLDAYVVSETDDIWYLTNITYQPEERPFLFIVTREEPILIVPELEKAHVDKGVLACKVITYWDYPAPVSENWYEVFRDTMSRFERVGIEHNVPTDVFMKMEAKEIVVSEMITNQRKVKSTYEIEKIRQSAKIADDAMSLIMKSVYKGASVIEPFALSRNIQTKLIKGKDFEPLITSLLTAVWPAPVSAMPHSVPELDDILRGGPNVAMAYFRINGYASECERTLFLEKPSETEEELFHHMMNARNEALKILRANVKASEVDAAANDYLGKYGLKSHLLHRTGHGIGLGNHEAPFLAEGSDEILQENMVVTVEPGIYIEGVGGYRHSDTVLITKDGYELLTKAPLELSDLVIKGNFSAKLKGKMMRKMLKMG